MVTSEFIVSLSFNFLTNFIRDTNKIYFAITVLDKGE